MVKKKKWGGLNVLENTPTHAKAKTPILFVHGMWDSADHFTVWMERCEEAGRKAFAVDLRGHGKSSGSLWKISFRNYLEDVMEVISEIGPQVVLAGHSMGGLIAQVVAAKSRAVEKAAFLASAGPRWVPLPLSLVWRMMRPPYIGAILRGRPFQITRQDASDLVFNVVPMERRAELYEKLGPESGHVALGLVFGIPVHKILCPTLVVSGEKDRMIPARIGRIIADKYASEFRVISGAGHSLMDEGEQGDALKFLLDWAA